MDVVLLLVRDRGERRRFPLSADVVVVGRREDCALRIPLGDVSRKHCTITKVGGAVRVQDLGSSNGTFVNGKRVQEVDLAPGDQLRIGSLRFIVQIDGNPADSDVDALTLTSDTTAGRKASSRDLEGIHTDAATARTDLPDDDA